MYRDYAVVRYLGIGVEQTHINGLDNALVLFSEEIKKDIKKDVELYRLKEGWTDLDADNVEEFPILTYDYEAEDFYVGKFGECVIFPIQNLKETKNIQGDSLEVSKFTSDKETFFFNENWMDYWDEPILEIK